MKRRSFIEGASAALLGAGLPKAARAGVLATSPLPPKSVFPRGFLWGASTSAHQVEGGNSNSDIWVLEHIKPSPFAEPSGDACDHWRRYREDIGLLAHFGLNTYRFSIEWARIEPEPGVFSKPVLEHYRRVAATCREFDVTPVVTFHHFSSPRWLAARGGWMEPEAADRFTRYCEIAAKALGDLMGLACTINEPNQPAANTVLRGGHEVDGVDKALALAAQAVGSDRFSAYNFGDHFKMRDVMLDAHRKAVTAIKSVAPQVPVGITLALSDMQAVPGGEKLYRQIFDASRGIFYDAIKGDDFVGVQTYSRLRIGAEGEVQPDAGAVRDQMNLEYWPQGLEATIREAATYTGIPVIVTENGIATEDDSQRIRHIDDTLVGVRRCLTDGIDLRGYLHWSLLDNFEWQMGYYPRYGLVAVDRTTFRRTPKPSAYHLGRIARRNGALLAQR